MTPIGRISTPQAAQLFCDYLRAQGIDADWLPDDSGLQLIRVMRLDQAAQAQQALREFLAQPQHPRYTQAAWSHGQARDARQSGSTGMQEIFRRLLVHAGPVTLSVGVLSLLTALYTGLGSNEFRVLPLLFSFPEILSGEIYRLLTPVILHFSLLHLLFNLLWWWQLGGAIEKHASPAQLLLIAGVSGLVSNLAQYIWSGPYFGGLSGVVYALFGYVWWRGRQERQFAVQLPSGVVSMMLIWLLVCMTGWLGPVANAAHVTGLLSGLVFAAQAAPRRR